MKGVFVAADIDLPQLRAGIQHLKQLHSPSDIVVAHTHDSPALGEINAAGQPVALGGTWHPYTGPGTRYIEGMLNDSWRWENLVAQDDGHRAALATIDPALFRGWYITEEADLAALTNVELRTKLGWYLIELIRRQWAIKPAPVVWSPFGTGNVTTAVVNAYRTLLVGVLGWLKTNDGIDVKPEVHFQSGVGAKHHTAATATTWGTRLKVATTRVSFFMNVEHFIRNPAGGFMPMPLAQIQSAESAFRTAGLSLGFLWEMRYWYPFVGYVANHTGV
jgi:fumarate reductase subunit D